MFPAFVHRKHRNSPFFLSMNTENDRNSQMNGIEILLKAVQDGTLLGSKTFANVEPDDIMGDRDDPVFGNRWMRVFEQVEHADLGESEAADVLRLQEISFRTSYKHCPGCDLPCYISDDFELIAKGFAADCEDEFLAGLLESYIKGQIPRTVVAPEPGVSLRSLLDRMR
jgi:hypothetical protein